MKITKYNCTYNELRLSSKTGVIYNYSDVSPYQYNLCIKTLQSNKPNMVWSILRGNKVFKMFEGCQSCGKALEVTQKTPLCRDCVAKADLVENENNNNGERISHENYQI